MASFSATLTETLQTSGSPSFITGRAVVLRDEANFRATLGMQYQAIQIVRERARLTSALVPNSKIAVALLDRLKVSLALTAGHAVRMMASFKISSRLSAAQATRLRENLGLVAREMVEGVYARTLRELLSLEDLEPHHAMALLMRAQLELTSNLERTYRAITHVGEMVELTSTLHEQLIIVVFVQDDLQLSGSELLRGIYQGHLFDALDFMLDVVSPSGDVTTWAMNARTGAVSEYLNFSFNSFALSPNGVHLGADSDGLYELAGPDDAGDPVVARLTSGLTDFSGLFYSGFKAAYLGIRGTGQFYLKLIAGDGKEYVYGVQADNLRTARVNMGKGLRAKYFTWDLISTGQDFDLTDVTFLPISSTRRV